VAEQFLKRPSLRPVKAQDHLRLNGGIIGDIAGFWHWAFSDLRDNTLLGLFGEWLVGILLGLEMDTRENWTSYDLKQGPLTIGVKTSSWLHPWAQARLTSPVFSGLLSKAWNPEIGAYAESAAYHTDWYVFCLQICQDGDSWDALDLDQWEFYLLPRETISRRGMKGISLVKLRSLSKALTAGAFQTEGRRILGIKPGDPVALVKGDEPDALPTKAIADDESAK
jgi:hypothetical protein